MNRRELLITLAAGAAGYAAVVTRPKVALGAAVSVPALPYDIFVLDPAIHGYEPVLTGRDVLWPRTLDEIMNSRFPDRYEYPPGHAARYDCPIR